jgi:hypothetical protein
MVGECQKPTWQFSGNGPVRLNFPQYRFDFEGLNFNCTAAALFLSLGSLQTQSESFGLASYRCLARRFLRMTNRPRRASFKFVRRPLVVSGQNWSRIRRLASKSDDGFPQHRVDGTSALIETFETAFMATSECRY